MTVEAWGKRSESPNHLAPLTAGVPYNPKILEVEAASGYVLMLFVNH